MITINNCFLFYYFLDSLDRRQLCMALPVPEFIEPVLGLKTSVFIKTSLKCSFSIETLLRDAISSLF
jgi:hypothetical protein